MTTKESTTIAHSLPFNVTDREEFLRIMDEVPDMAVSEEEVDDQVMVRLWAESGSWPAAETIAEMISPHLPEGEVAILQHTTVRGFNQSAMNMTAINSEGDYIERHSTEWADQMREEIGVKMASAEYDESAEIDEDED